MRLYEHESKKVFEGMGLSIPQQFGVIHSPDELDGLDLEFPVMLKSMVLIGGRGKAGGIKKASNLEEAKSVAGDMFKLVIKGYPVDTLLVEAVASEAGACYVGITTNPANFDILLMASAEGGVEIEKVALGKPEAILRQELPENDLELPESIAKSYAGFLNKTLKVDESAEEKLADAISKLYQTYQKFDCKIAEINPLLVTQEGEIVAADAKVVLDDNSLYRQGALFELLEIKGARHDVSEPTRDEVRAREAGFIYVDLFPEDYKKDPDKLYVGLVPGGAGYGIFSIDETANVGDRFFGGKVIPINFMDSGGGPTLSRVAEMFHLLMDKELVDIIITSRFGGISSCDIFIRGCVKCMRDRYQEGKRVIPVHGRMVGTDLPSARDFLLKAKVETPEELKHLEIVIGNQKIMADIIKEGITRGLEHMSQKGGQK